MNRGIFDQQAPVVEKYREISDCSGTHGGGSSKMTLQQVMVDRQVAGGDENVDVLIEFRLLW